MSVNIVLCSRNCQRWTYGKDSLMWQEILAVDSRFAKLRSLEARNVSQQTQSGSLSLYLKRRLQLLQVQRSQASLESFGLSDEMECPDEKDEATFVTHRPGFQINYKFSYSIQIFLFIVMRNRKYLSLRVKLLKRQFGLPHDVMSLKSLSISSPYSWRLNHSGKDKKFRLLEDVPLFKTYFDAPRY